jgi:16S rRNA (cytidine1402-2'-O)-methyltransferase
MRKGQLFLVPNTLGDEDRAAQLPNVIPPFVAQTAAQLDHWIVENAKTARNFLSAVNRLTPLRVPLQEMQIQVWKGPSPGVDPRNLLLPLNQGFDVGLMSEAGLPAIADPGTEIVALAHQLGFPVRPLTGPSSLMLALMASGMNGQCFTFHGYLPIKNPERLMKLRTIESASKLNHSAQIWIETPYRNTSMLTSLTDALAPNTQLCLGIDLTLPSEQIMRHSISQWQIMLSKSSNLLTGLDKRPAVFVMQAV